MTLKEYTASVIAVVKARLKGQPWYRGVCLDTVEDSFNQGRSIEDAAVTAESDTVIWDAR